MKRLTLIVLACLAASPATKPVRHLRDDAPEAVKLFWFSSHPADKRQRLIELNQLLADDNKKLRQVEAGKIGEDFIDAAAKADARKQQQAAVVARKKQITDTQNAKPKVNVGTDAFVSDMKDGWLGRISVISVTQVVDKDTAIVSTLVKEKHAITTPVDSPNSGRKHLGGDVIYLDRQTKLDIWLTGFDTAGMTDGGRWTQDQPVVLVTGTKQYETVAGSTRTIVAAEKFDVTKYLEDAAE